MLLVSSYVFYAAWNPPFVIFLWISSLIDFFASLQIASTDKKRIRKTWMGISLVANLGLLAFFKYGNFFIQNWNYVFPDNMSITAYNIILPVGISFYTFQTLSYTLDVYYDKIKPSRNLLDYLLYVTFFPQLVAGPIVRADLFLNQCAVEKKFDWDQFGYGLFWLIVGLFLKIVVADYLLAPVVEIVYTAKVIPNTLSAWMGTLAFAGQILCDFCGYSICAIGAAQMLGFHLPKNFRFPYAADSFSDFWRRWHISLSSWLRDYVYIPMGGNRYGTFRTYQNLMVTMLVGGLWHGASWTFVVWGGLHGLYLSAERYLRGKVSVLLPKWISILIVFVLVCFTWVFFRASSFKQAGEISGAMLGIGKGISLVSIKSTLTVLAVTVIVLLLSYLFRDMDLEKKVMALAWWKISAALVFFLYFIITLSGEDRSFIYFQF